MTEKENSLITSLLSIEEKKLFKKYLEEYNDLFHKILLLSSSEFIHKLISLVEYALRLKNNKYSKKSKEKIEEIIIEKYYKIDYEISQKIKLKKNEINKEYFKGEIIPHCDKDKLNNYYIHSCGEKFIKNEIDKKIFLFCEKCDMIYKENLIKFKCAENNIEFYSKLIRNDINKNNEDDLPYATWAKYHCNAVINDLMKCQKCSNNLFLLKKVLKNSEKKYLYCKKCKKAWYPSFLQWECLICKKLFTCDAKAYNPLEFKTIKICIKEAIVNKIKAVPQYLECNCEFNFSEINFFHKVNCRGELFFGELNGKKTVVCDKCDSIGFYDGYIWTCPICLKKTKNKIIDNNKHYNNINNNIETKSMIHLNNPKEENNKILYNKINHSINNNINDNINDNKNDKQKDKDNISMSKIRIRNKYKMLKKYNLTENNNLSTNNIKNNNNISNNKEETNKNDQLNNNNNNKILNKIGELKQKFSFYNLKKEYQTNDNILKHQEKHSNDIDDINDINNSNKKKMQKIKKYLSVLNTDNRSYIKHIIDKNLEIKADINNINNINISQTKNMLQNKLKPCLTSNDIAIKNKNNQNENMKRKDSFMSRFNKYKLSSKLSRINSGKNLDKNNNKSNNYNINKTQNENKSDINISSEILNKEEKSMRHSKIFHRYKNNIINGINNRISRNNQINLDINISKDFKTENNIINKNKINIDINLNKNSEKNQSNEKEQNMDNYYNNKKGSNSTADNSDNTTKIIYHVKNPKQSFQIKKNKNTINLENYKIIKKIGQGSFGQIFEIEDNLKNKYALKKIIVTQESDIKKIEHEYQILIDLNSLKKNLNLNLVKIYGFSSKQLDPTTYVIYVLMELAKTDWEKEILHRQKTKSYYSEENLLKILSSLVKTFAQLQKNNVSHRDIKPQNILIFGGEAGSKEGDVYKLADFGEAKELIKDLEATNKQTLRGTELYMAPVLFQALRSKKMIKYIKHNTYKSDVFSFGLCSLFAATLCFESVYDVREAKNNVSIRFILEKYLSKRYSFDTINIISQMLDINEITRKDFIELEKEFELIGYE